MRLRLHEGNVVSELGDVVLRGASPEIGTDGDEAELGLFLSARAAASSSRLLFKLGQLEGLERFTACHRYEPYWMKPAVGERLRELPTETQFLLARRADGLHVLCVPLLAELFRFSLRGGGDDTLTLVGETGDAFTPGTGGLAAYLALGQDPYELVERAARVVARRLGIERLRRDKPLPDFVQGFGWCTWDAFYQEVSSERVLAGLSAFRAGGVEPRFLILDDGWQSVQRRPTGESRLTAFGANAKFEGGLSALVAQAKQHFQVRHFLVWHALVGYWGGVDGEALSGYGVRDHTRQFGDGILAHAPTFNQEWWGALVGLVPAEHIARFYDDYHASLAAAGVDGVKVDSQAVLEALAHGEGGRVPLSRAYRAALEQSVAKHFGGRLINCMSNAQETWYGSPGSTLIRSSIDFFPALPASHGAHLFANAHVGLWFGEFMHPDWDMFQSSHVFGAYHAAARAVSGGPVYVSDKPGAHDFQLLGRLVCSDGSVLGCDEPGRPTPDVLYRDPTREDVPMKIYNRCGKAFMLGAFNARIGSENDKGPDVQAMLGPADVPGISSARFACYFHVAGRLELMDASQRRGVTLAERQFELVTLVAIVGGFAAIGLVEKFASQAAIGELAGGAGRYELTLRDGGTFLAWCEQRPVNVEVDGRAASFEFDMTSGALRVPLAASGKLLIELARAS